ncbi:hypothetical protein C4E22_06990, partial [ANME-1 cluster archaeon AG-394-G06]|nr:hypothetical protein [ANME-1 cluster archaeon AG-394-G06]
MLKVVSATMSMRMKQRGVHVLMRVWLTNTNTNSSHSDVLMLMQMMLFGVNMGMRVCRSFVEMEVCVFIIVTTSQHAISKIIKNAPALVPVI